MSVLSAVVIAACASHKTMQSQDAAGAMSDACPSPVMNYVPTDDCAPDGLASLALDGTWRMQGSASSWTQMNGSNRMTTTEAVDTSVTIARMGCSTSLAIGSAAATSYATSGTTTALTYDCYHSGWDCMLGEISWSICVSGTTGLLRYRRYESQQKLDRAWGLDEVDTLTR